MKRSTKKLALTGLLLSAHLLLGACQASQDSQQAASPERVKVAERQLEKAKSYVVVADIQEDGYVMVHGNHYHLEKKAIPFNAKFLKDTVVPDDYQLKMTDVIMEVEKGYIVKVDGRFYYYPNDKERKANVVSLKEARKLTKNLKLDDHHKEEKSAGKKGEVAGIDKPTSDGFLLTDEKQITSRTDTGIVVDHNGHSHFIFYDDLKGSKWAYLIPENYRAQSRPSQAPTKKVAQHHDQEDHYVFDPKDIVAEDANGYTVRHGDHYHYILKSQLSQRQRHSLHPLNSPETNGHQGGQGGTIATPPLGHRPGIDKPTSDGFIFDGTGIVGRTDFGLLVDHNGHTHVVSYDSLRGTRFEHLIPQKPKAPERPPIVQPKPDKPSQPSVPRQPQPPSSPQDELEAKKAHLARSLGVPISSIRVVDTDKGKVFIYPHDDHEHAISVDKISLDKPVEDPHAHDDPHAHQAVGMATLKKLGFDKDIIDDILHARADTEFPAQETDPEKMKEWLKTVKYLNIGQRENPLERKGLELMPNIEVLGIGFTPIQDLRPLYQFKHLKHLWMTQTGIKDYSFLKHLPSLEGIDISQNGVSDLSFLKDYPHLKSVAAAGNDIKDISVLAQLPGLTSLNLDYNKISDLSALRSLSQLEAVSLEHNSLMDLSALSGKDKLTRLFVSNNPEVKLDSLQASQLEELTANNNKVSDLNFLKQLPGLKTLHLEANKLKSLSGLEQAKQLESLSVSKNQIERLELKADQTSLSRINLSHNQLLNLSGINRFKALAHVNAAHNKLTTLTLDEANQTIRHLDVSHNHIPQEELTLNEQKIPLGIAKNFTSTESGDISANSKADETAQAAAIASEDSSVAKQETVGASQASPKAEEGTQTLPVLDAAGQGEVERLAADISLEITQKTGIASEVKESYSARLREILANFYQSARSQSVLEACLNSLMLLKAELAALLPQVSDQTEPEAEQSGQAIADAPSEAPLSDGGQASQSESMTRTETGESQSPSQTEPATAPLTSAQDSQPLSHLD